MRSDYALYIVAAFFFILTTMSAILIVEAERNLWMVSTAVLGLLSVGLGYYQRPKAFMPSQKVQQAAEISEAIAGPEPQAEPLEVASPVVEVPPVEEKPEVHATPEIEVPPPTETPVQPPVIETQSTIEETAAIEAQVVETNPAEAIHQVAISPLTEVKGIGERRAAQLNALGINTVEELAQASPEDLARKLKISPKIVAKWVDNAKKIK